MVSLVLWDDLVVYGRCPTTGVTSGAPFLHQFNVFFHGMGALLSPSLMKTARLRIYIHGAERR
jgi:hypothetical protein